MCLGRPHKHRGSVTSEHHMAGDSQLESSLVSSAGMHCAESRGDPVGCPLHPTRCTASGSWSQALKSSFCLPASDQLRDKLRLAHGTPRGVCPKAAGRFSLARNIAPASSFSCQL